jgi:fatty acid-binding protein DegV
MGECKEEMKPSKAEPAKSGIIDGLKSRVGRGRRLVDTGDNVKTFNDHLQICREKTDHLVTVKHNELLTEKGREAYNAAALEKLRNMQALLDRVDELMDQYLNLSDKGIEVYESEAKN